MEDEIIITYAQVKNWLADKTTEIDSEPFLSEDVLFILIDEEKLPTASSLYSFLKKRDYKVIFKEYWGNEIPLNVVKANLNGLFIADASIKNDDGISLEILSPEEVEWPENISSEQAVVLKMGQISSDISIWDILRNEYILLVNFAAVICGNILFSKSEYEQMIKSNTLKGVEVISTYETQTSSS
jgi:hypothetical protein